MARTTVKHIDGMRFVGAGRSGHAILMDASEEVGGADSGPRPLEMVLVALGGCTGMDVVSLLRKMRTEPTGLEIEVEDERAEAYPKALKKIHLRYRVRGDVPEENLRKAIELSLSKYCPVANSLAGVAEITWESVIERG